MPFLCKSRRNPGKRINYKVKKIHEFRLDNRFGVLIRKFMDFLLTYSSQPHTKPNYSLLINQCPVKFGVYCATTLWSITVIVNYSLLINFPLYSIMFN